MPYVCNHLTQEGHTKQSCDFVRAENNPDGISEDDRLFWSFVLAEDKSAVFGDDSSSDSEDDGDSDGSDDDIESGEESMDVD